MEVEGGEHSLLKLAARHIVGKRIGSHFLIHLIKFLGIPIGIHHRLGDMVMELALRFLQVHLSQLPVVASFLHRVPRHIIIYRYRESQCEVLTSIVAKLRGKALVLSSLREISIEVGRDAATEREGWQQPTLRYLIIISCLLHLILSRLDIGRGIQEILVNSFVVYRKRFVYLFTICY